MVLSSDYSKEWGGNFKSIRDNRFPYLYLPNAIKNLGGRGAFLKSPRSNSSYKIIKVVIVIALITVLNTNNSYAIDKNHIITYAGSLLTPLELSAAIKLWNRESHWNPRARNGSHYGICQGKSVWLSKQGYKNQVQWCIHYAWRRYGTIANAYNAYLVKGWH